MSDLSSDLKLLINLRKVLVRDQDKIFSTSIFSNKEGEVL